jgi:hypothetical protein
MLLSVSVSFINVLFDAGGGPKNMMMIITRFATWGSKRTLQEGRASVVVCLPLTQITQLLEIRDNKP